MPAGVFVTGTDTNVGKTVVSAALMALYRGRGPVKYWKPIQTGIERDDDTAMVSRLARCSADERLDRGVRLPRPVSPHLAAKAAGVSLTISSVCEALGAVPAQALASSSFWIVEGAGGVHVPINDEQLMIDVIAALGLPAVVVARTALGTINHTLLTLDALRGRGIEIAGVVMSGDPDVGAREAIAHHGRVLVAELPTLTPLTPDTIERWAAGARGSWPI